MSDITDEEELQAILESAPEEFDPDNFTYCYGSADTPEFWQWDQRASRDAAMGCTIRVQERIGAYGQVEQRFRVRYDEGTQDEWTLWYSALESWAIKRH